MPSNCFVRIPFLAALVVALGSSARAEEVEWRSDYVAARREAVEKDRPLVLDVGTEGCLWCRRLDAITFRDPAVVRLLTRHFVSVRIDASRNEALAEKLRLKAYPTLLLAAPDGRILEVLEGFQDAPTFQQRLEGVLTQLGRSAVPMPVSRPEGGLGASPITRSELSEEARGQRARELLSQAREDFRAGQYAVCLHRCDALVITFADQPAAEEARRLAAEIRANPEWMRLACESLSDQLGSMYLTLAETWMKRGQPQQATACLERVVQTLPGTRAADAAQRRLSQIQGVTPTRLGDGKDR